jgi:hypothetical protein
MMNLPARTPAKFHATVFALLARFGADEGVSGKGIQKSCLN